MLLTFLQLHILLVAAPAFANWMLACPATLGSAPAVPAQVASLACRTVWEAAAPTTAERHSFTMRRSQTRLAICQSLAADGRVPVTDGSAFSAADAAVLGSLAPFPHAARAP